jgi:hypothetical protein
VSPSEFAFLALGLMLGVASGAALVEILRSRPPAPREVRLTVAPDAIPRRPAATLSTAAFAGEAAEVARGGPADRRGADRDSPPNDPPPGTPGAPSWPAPLAARMTAGTTGPVAGAAGALIGMPIHRETDPTMAALRRIAAVSAERSMRVGTATAVLDPPADSWNGADAHALDHVDPPRGDAGSGRAGDQGGTTPGTDEAPVPIDSGPCADERRVAEERCTLAGRAREQAESAHEALRSAQRAYDDHLTRADRASADADPRAVRAAKETAQHVFRAGRAAATTREAVEAAARDWLGEINRINLVARDAAIHLERERAGANALVTEIERLTVEADAARISAETAEAACLAAREAVANCQEALTEPIASIPVPRPPEPPGRSAPPPPSDWESGDEAAIAMALGHGEPAILKLLQGDRPTLQAVAAALGGEDPADRRRWQVALSGLVEAIVARAIEASSLDFPADHPFWGPFTRSQNRDIAAALSSLGYRYDGLGDWLDGRIPSQRDLSLAVGYAGLDPMRIRHWPNEAEMVELYRDVTVAADEYLAGAAGGLTLGELVTVLGLRADGLTDLWNEWGRVRPLLLAAT